MPREVIAKSLERAMREKWERSADLVRRHIEARTGQRMWRVAREDGESFLERRKVTYGKPERVKEDGE